MVHFGAIANDPLESRLQAWTKTNSSDTCLFVLDKDGGVSTMQGQVFMFSLVLIGAIGAVFLWVVMRA